MADVLKRLVGPYAVPATNTTVYTAATGVTAVLRNIHVANIGSTQVNFTLTISGTGSSASFFYVYPIAPAAVLDWSGMLVLAPADYISVLASTLSSLTLTISGVEAS